MGRLIHYSIEPLTEVHSSDQDGPPHFMFKPKGLWVSVEGKNDWVEWCLWKKFGLDRLICATQIVLKPDANVLHIASAESLDEFNDRYSNDSEFSVYSIDWNAVAVDHQGIIIAPHIWERRLGNHCFWYYTWDCACGCIWDAAAVERVAPIAQWDLAARQALHSDAARNEV